MEEMKAAGLPGKVAYTIKRYREKGGRFYQKTDLLKIYDMTVPCLPGLSISSFLRSKATSGDTECQDHHQYQCG